MAGHATVHQGAISNLLRAATAMGVDAQRLLARARVPGPLRSPAQRASRGLLLTLKAALAAELDDPCVGFRLGAEIPFTDLDVYGAHAVQAGSLREIVSRALHFMEVWEQDTTVRFTETGTRARLSYASRGSPARGVLVDCQQTTSMLALAISQVAGPDAAVRMGCVGARPAHAACLGALRKARVTVGFEQTEWHVEFDRVVLDRPLRRGAPALERIAEAHLVEAHRSVVSARRPEERLERLLRAHLHDGLQQADFARTLGMSRRSLQVLLQSKGLTFSGLRARVRLERAQELLADEQPIKHVASALGFGNTAAFSRFYRQHVGSAPTSARRQARRATKRP